jgi:large subunit ribosomal protein L5
MKTIKVEKVTLNIGVGEPGEKLEKAKTLLATISGCKPVITTAKDRIPTWGLRPGLQIATKVTIRGEKAVILLKRLLQAKDNILKETSFDKFGNFSFGIHEYIEIPGVEYDMKIGIIGLETAVTLERPGYRIKKRRIKKAKIATRHLISKDESINFMKEKFNVVIKK